MDKYKLEYEMKSRGITVEKMCADIHMRRSAFYRKCKGITQFTQGEIQSIVDYIGLDSPMGIFCWKSVIKDTICSIGGRMKKPKFFSPYEGKTRINTRKSR